jgi:hypothetical protein
MGKRIKWLILPLHESEANGTEQKFDGDRTFSAAGVGLEHKF